MRDQTTDTCRSERKPFLSVAKPEDIAEFVAKTSNKAFRAKQIYDWVAKKWVVNPDNMSNISNEIKAQLKEYFTCDSLKVEQDNVSEDGSHKVLLSLADGESVECATIPALDGRVTFCLSTQVGCPVSCAFCASGANGLVRNLTSGEMVEEFLLLTRMSGKLPDNVVIMGVGEPLLNYTNLVEALETICNPEGIALSARRVTISTSGWVPGIRNLAELGRQWNLAVSLHAPDDKVRAMLIPDKYRRSIKEIIQACKLHREHTGRLLTLEYVLLRGINDAAEQAARLAKLAIEANAKINLIPYNKASGAFERPSKDTIKRFENTIKSAGVPVTVRVEKGFDSGAACGQLRASAQKAKKSGHA